MTSKAQVLQSILRSDQLDFIMEAHSGLSAKVAEEAGFHALWGSGLSIAASMGVRDSNEMSWTQVLDHVEFIADAVRIPVLLDGDTGYGNFNNMRRLVQKLESRHVAGVCIEDKLFPKTNSFIGSHQPLADIDEFCGKIKAGKDAQVDDAFCIVARVEAFIAGRSLSEALKRAEAYRAAGADAILIHSRLSRPTEVLAFKATWGNRGPVIIVPTSYYSTPTEVFRKAGFSVVIWANQLMRSSLKAMQETAFRLARAESAADVEERIASVEEVFRIQGVKELGDAELRYLPCKGRPMQAVILAAGRGGELGTLTEEVPKAMVEIAGKPLLQRTVETLNALGIEDIAVVRGYKKETMNVLDLRFVDNDEHASTFEVFSLALGLAAVTGPALVTYGDVLFQRFIPMAVCASPADFSIAVDPSLRSDRDRRDYRDLVVCDRPFDVSRFDEPTSLQLMSDLIADGEADGEWIGVLKVSERGCSFLKERLALLPRETDLREMRMAGLFRLLVHEGVSVEVIYVRGQWLDVDDVHDVVAVSSYGEVAKR